jgi:hypothetical protein
MARSVQPQRVSPTLPALPERAHTGATPGDLPELTARWSRSPRSQGSTRTPSRPATRRCRRHGCPRSHRGFRIGPRGRPRRPRRGEPATHHGNVQRVPTPAARRNAEPKFCRSSTLTPHPMSAPRLLVSLGVTTLAAAATLTAQTAATRPPASPAPPAAAAETLQLDPFTVTVVRKGSLELGTGRTARPYALSRNAFCCSRLPRGAAEITPERQRAPGAIFVRN